MSGPGTEAGRRAVGRYGAWIGTKAITDDVLAIEAEAARSAAAPDPEGLREALREQVEALERFVPAADGGMDVADGGYWIWRDSVRALLATPPAPRDHRYVDPRDLPDSFYRRNPDYQGEPVIDSTPPAPSDHGAALDVERLARAIRLVPVGLRGAHHVEAAIAIAAEYARLAPSVPPEET